MKALWIGMVLFGIVFAGWWIWDTQQSTDLSPHDHSFLLQSRDGRLMLEYVAGGGLPSQDTRILVTVGNERATLAGADAGFGGAWDPGESVCIAGEGCMVEGGDMQVQVEYGASIVYSAQRTF